MITRIVTMAEIHQKPPFLMDLRGAAAGINRDALDSADIIIKNFVLLVKKAPAKK
jgi:hypothetical protein